MSRICVKNIGKNTTDDQLRKLFSTKGEVTDVKVIKTKEGKSRNFAFIGFRTEVQAEDAKKFFNNTFIGQSKIFVDIAKKLNDESLIKQNHRQPAKLRSKSTEVVSNESTKSQRVASDPSKEEYLKVMKSRNKSNVWDNDEATKQPKLKQDDSDDESVNDMIVDVKDVNSSVNGDEDKDDFAIDNKFSDMDYLRSKVRRSSASTDSESEDEPHENDKVDVPVENDSVGHGGSVGAAEEADVRIVEDDDDDLEVAGRLFVKNLPFACTEEELAELFQRFGSIAEVHLPMDKEQKRGKGFGFVRFLLPEQANNALHAMDGASFQGRILHIVHAEKQHKSEDGVVRNSRLSSFQQKKEEERRKFLNRKEGWNSTYVRSDAVVDTLADRYGVTKAKILDVGEGGGELAVRLAIGETQVIQENKEYFAQYGIDLSVLESSNSSQRAAKRSGTTILIKNLPHNLVEEEVESMFAKFGAIRAFLIPKSKLVAVVDFVEPNEARAAYKALAYRSYKHVPLYLEWAPLNLINKQAQPHAKVDEKKESEKASLSSSVAVAAAAVDPAGAAEECSTLFVKNLNFSTTEQNLRDNLLRLGVEGVRAVSIQHKMKGSQALSMGYGFIEFSSFHAAQAGQNQLRGTVLDSHALEVKPSDKRLSAAPAGKISQDNSKNNKLVVRNVAFQATKQEIRSLFAAFGTVKRVRIPKKMGGEHRGFAFVDFSTAQEAQTAMNSLKNTHLYGRHLILEWAKDEDDPANANQLSNIRKRTRSDVKVMQVHAKKAKIEDTLQGGEGGDMDDDRDDE